MARRVRRKPGLGASLAVLVVMFLGFLPAARGQCDAAWVQGSTTGPGNRGGYALAYDSDRHVAVLFGGSNGSTELNDLWEWDGTTWTQIPTVGTPSPRNGIMVYDPVMHLMLFSCGSTGDPIIVHPETYSYNTSTREWVLRSSTPPCNQARSAHAMAYDAARNQIVLFGGFTYTAGSGSTNHTTVWNWATSSWEQCDLFTPPQPRGGMGMCYDPNRQRVVMFGGHAGNACPSTTYSDTWEWDGSLWTLQSVGTSPNPRAFFGMAYDPRSQRSVIFGGRNYSGCNVYPGDTWAWSGTEWSNLNASEPLALTSIAMVYDTARGNMVFYGGATASSGHSDTWTLRTHCPADINCDGSANSQDFFAYIGFFFGNLPQADFNRDGLVTSQDFFDFLAAFFAGCA